MLFRFSYLFSRIVTVDRNTDKEEKHANTLFLLFRHDKSSTYISQTLPRNVLCPLSTRRESLSLCFLSSSDSELALGSEFASITGSSATVRVVPRGGASATTVTTAADAEVFLGTLALADAAAAGQYFCLHAADVVLQPSVQLPLQVLPQSILIHDLLIKGLK